MRPIREVTLCEAELWLLPAMLAAAPLGARAANLVLWWENGFHAQEDEAVAEIPAAFEREGGRHVELCPNPRRQLKQARATGDYLALKDKGCRAARGRAMIC